MLGLAAPSANAAETWICPAGTPSAGEYTIDGDKLLTPGPAGSPRGSLTVVKNTPDMVIAMSNVYAEDRIALIMIDRKHARYKIHTVGDIVADADNRSGPCTKR
jgi:hypothetical protein